MIAPALEPDYFDRLYAGDPDPWRFATSAYEAAKYTATLAALSRVRYRHGLEIGCSIGVLTERLAGRCERILGTDVAEAPLVAARRRAPDNADFARFRLPSERPPGRYDLVVLSEVLYYFDAVSISAMADAVAALAMPAADVLLVHWLGPTPDYPMAGDNAVAALFDAMGSRAVVTLQHRTPDYRLDRLQMV